MYYPPDGYSVLETSKRKRCCSCKDLIDIGSTVAKFPRMRYPQNEVELNIYGEDGEIFLANHYMCEECADLFFSLDELGFCVRIGDESMRELTKQYAETYGPKANTRPVSA